MQRTKLFCKYTNLHDHPISMIDMQQQQQQKKHLGKEKSTYKEFLMYSFDCDKFWITIMFYCFHSLLD